MAKKFNFFIQGIPIDDLDIGTPATNKLFDEIEEDAKRILHFYGATRSGKTERLKHSMGMDYVKPGVFAEAIDKEKQRKEQLDTDRYKVLALKIAQHKVNVEGGCCRYSNGILSYRLKPIFSSDPITIHI